MKELAVMKYEAGLDYLTVVSHSHEGAALIDRYGWAVVEREEDNGGIIKSKFIGGYDGYQVNQMFYGVRADGAMIRVSGPKAIELAEAMDWRHVHPTRVDAQVTVWYETHDPGEAEANYLKAMLYRAENPKLQLAIPKLLKTQDHGSNLMMGSRSSPKYGRNYDKYAESRDDYYYGAWRYEVEFKADAAKEALRQLRLCNYDPGCVSGLVVGQWISWGVPLPSSCGAGIDPVALSRAKTDAASQLQWLGDQVSGTVDKLCKAGYREAVLAALGLDD
jgi:hypothetical protein